MDSTVEKIDLMDCTFIIPVKLESDHRIKNAKIVFNQVRVTNEQIAKGF